jgi:hypothetical protein
MENEMNNGSNNNTTENKMNNAMACLITNSGIISIVINGKPYSVAPDHLNYKALIKAIKANDQEAIMELVDIPKAISSFTSGAVSVIDNQVLFNGEAIHTSIANRILGLMTEDMPFKFMVCFLDNLMKNPSYRAIHELYDFLEFANIPITDDGCFLAYKRVDENYMDIYTRKVSNAIGEKPEMPRNMVDEDKNRTCSNGYHFCSLEYIPNFGATQETSTDKVMIVKVNPRDVVAIPADYNNTKGRCCLYEVVAEYEGDWRTDAFTKPVHHKDGTPYELDGELDGEEHSSDDEISGYDDDGYDENGLNRDGLDSNGFDENGFDGDGYDSDGYDRGGYDGDGYDRDGLDAEGFDWDGHDENGFDRSGFNKDGFNEDGIDQDGYNEEGFDEDGLDRAGNPEINPREDDDEGDLGDGDLGIKPSGQKFYNVRNADGKFVSKGDK